MLYRNLDTLHLDTTKAAIGFLYAGYRLSAWWFELVDMLHKLFLTSLLDFFPTDAQLPLGMCIAMVYLVTLLRTNPYIRKEDDKLHLLCQIEIMLLLAAGYVFYENPSLAIDSWQDWVLSFVLIGIACVFFCAVLYLAGLVCLRFYRKYQAERDPEANKKRQAAEDKEKAKRSALLAARQDAFFQRQARPDFIYV